MMRTDPAGAVVLFASFPESIVSFRGALIGALRSRSFAVHVAAPHLSHLARVRENLFGLGAVVHEIRLQRTGLNPGADILAFWQMFRLLKRTKPEIALAYTVKPILYGMLAARLARVPRRFALVTGLGFAFTGGKRSFMAKVVRLLYRLALQSCHKVFFQNPDDQALLRELGILPPDVPSVVVPGSGIDVSHYRQMPLPGFPPRFLMIARLLGDKGVREYVKAARLIKGKHPEARFALAGWIDGSPDSIAQSELEEWIRQGDIEFYGRLDDVRPAIADCSVYVLPSYREGTPRSVLEAMAMGRAVITTDAPGCRETVVDGLNGLLVPVGSERALAEAMERFIEAPEMAVEMGLRSRQLAESKYDVKMVNGIMLREMWVS